VAGKGEMSRRKAWLIVLVSFLDDAVVLALIFLGLWLFHVKITWTLILIIGLVMVAFVFIMHKAVVPSLRRRKVAGSEGMIGTVGMVMEPLNPEGTVKVKDEYWKARSVEGDIMVGEEVEVMGVTGLKLEVKKKTT
jgi:membrane protein implicated in regulation of membrane protease activity